jgi:hypothetical protein
MAPRSVDPTGKRALFGSPPAAAGDRLAPGLPSEGRAALFSTAPRQAGTVVVECSHCRVRSRVSLFELGLRLFSGSAWLPLRHHPHWMRCPSCRQRRWCRIGWND